MRKTPQNTTIKVACRLRPLNALEKSTGGDCCLTYTDKAIKVKVEGEDKPYEFTFDHIFGPETPQSHVYNCVAKPVLIGLMEGFNGTIFAYGQTSSGKTFTMEGPDIIDTEEKVGIIPRMMNHLFELILNSDENIEFNVKVSFLELYNEKLHDLLDPRKTNLQIKEDKTKGIFVQDVTEIYVTSGEQMRQVHKKGSENKTIAATRMNERSSRSHSIFILNLIQKNTATEAVKHSKLYFVDLAGSEKIAKTHVTGQQLEEAKNINKSLSALGLVINALTEKKENTHVPYRDSKLTRLLQESLGGNSQTSLILACSMCSYNDKETLSTLRFGNRAKNVKNTPTVNVERSAKEYMAMLEVAEKTIKEQEILIKALQAQIDSPDHVNLMRIDANSSQVEEKEFNEDQNNIVDTSKPNQPENGVSNSKENNQVPATLKVLKQQIQISNLMEELTEAQNAQNDLEKELNSKNLEIYDLNAKILNYEHELTELTNKNLESLEGFRLSYDKVCLENQEKRSAMNKFLTGLQRLKSDLHFMYISKNLKMLDLAEKSNSPLKKSQEVDESAQQSQINKEDLMINSIQKTIEMLEDIEKDLGESEKKSATSRDTETLIETLLRDSEPSSIKKGYAYSKKSESATHNDTDTHPENMNTSSDEEESVSKRLGIEDSTDGGKESVSDADTKFDFETLENFEEFSQKLQAMANDDQKINELQNLVNVQRKTITSLSKKYNELSKTNQTSQTTNEKKIEGYINKIDTLEKQKVEERQEREEKISTLKHLLEKKIKEIEESKKDQDKELLEKSKQISELKYQTERMQKIILGSDLPKKVYELENKINEFILERQRLSEEVFKLRADNDEKTDILEDKNSQIQLLQNNLNTLSNELEILKHFRPKPAQDAFSKKVVDDNKTPQWVKNQMIVPEKHIIKPIRGGGGNVKNFERDNFLLFEKPSILGETSLSRQEMRPSTIRGSRKISDGPPEETETSSVGRNRVSTMQAQSQNKQWAKLGEMLRSETGKKSLFNDTKLNSSTKQQQRSLYGRDTGNVTHEESKIDESIEKTKKGKSEKNDQEGQGSIKNILHNVKSFFS